VPGFPRSTSPAPPGCLIIKVTGLKVVAGAGTVKVHISLHHLVLPLFLLPANKNRKKPLNIFFTLSWKN